jgi:gluconokinase
MHELGCVVVMGVSGSGKTTVGLALAQRLGWVFVEGDDFHTEESIAKMREGVPLTDADRLPWVETLRDSVRDHHAEGRAVVMTCSALRRRYRELLAEGRPWIRFCHLTLSDQVLSARLAGRRGHYMSASLLQSQLETLEPLGPDEPGVEVDGTGTPEQVVDRVLSALDLSQPPRR